MTYIHTYLLAMLQQPQQRLVVGTGVLYVAGRRPLAARRPVRRRIWQVQRLRLLLGVGGEPAAAQAAAQTWQTASRGQLIKPSSRGGRQRSRSGRHTVGAQSVRKHTVMSYKHTALQSETCGKAEHKHLAHGWWIEFMIHGSNDRVI